MWSLAKGYKAKYESVNDSHSKEVCNRCSSSRERSRQVSWRRLCMTTKRFREETSAMGGSRRLQEVQKPFFSGLPMSIFIISRNQRNTNDKMVQKSEIARSAEK